MAAEGEKPQEAEGKVAEKPLIPVPVRWLGLAKVCGGSEIDAVY